LSFVNGDGGRQERACCLADDDDDAPAVYFLLLFWGLVRNIILGLSTWLAGRPLSCVSERGEHGSSPISYFGFFCNLDPLFPLSCWEFVSLPESIAIG
jgi:hypothetical protein